MGDAQRGDDAIAFFAARLGPTRYIRARSNLSRQLTDLEGPLRPVRHLIQVANFSSAGNTVWIKMGKFQKGVNLGVTAAPPNFPMQPGVVCAIEVNVRKGEDDQIAATVSGNNVEADVFITEISRRA